MLTRYNRRKHNAMRERGKRMAAARWKAERDRQNAEMPARIRELEEIAIQNLPHRPGDPLGCLQWHDYRTGRVRRWIVRIGDQPTASHGWTWLTEKIRAHLCRPAP